MTGTRLLLEHVRSRLAIYLGAMLLMILANILFATYPRILGSFADQMTTGDGNIDTILHTTWLLLGVAVGYSIFFGFGQYMTMRLGRAFEYKARKNLSFSDRRLPHHGMLGRCPMSKWEKNVG
ncbi:hypothetical protein G4V62_14535 [Bacillaceae bacterium SIJ1]|uniref:hypothetical protein n=1 Tax=Litoribacterium kuwaitense TaxID=1398745 RepID=UPI0013ECF9F4|nr:hypothetical protein [Litoribacterium kuwaitense]NGP46109.1 hypothetical protein [Litoribacterium kuwaitense]